MAAMSELAYLRFEDADGLSGLLDGLARAVGQERSAVAAALAPLPDVGGKGALRASGEDRLGRILDSIGFDVLRTFSQRVSGR